MADKIRASGGVARSSDASVTDRGAVHRLFRDVVTEFGALDIVINKAGILRFPSFLDAEQDDWVAAPMSTSTAEPSGAGGHGFVRKYGYPRRG